MGHSEGPRLPQEYVVYAECVAYEECEAAQSHCLNSAAVLWMMQVWWMKWWLWQW